MSTPLHQLEAQNPTLEFWTHAASPAVVMQACSSLEPVRFLCPVNPSTVSLALNRGVSGCDPCRLLTGATWRFVRRLPSLSSPATRPPPALRRIRGCWARQPTLMGYRHQDPRWPLERNRGPRSPGVPAVGSIPRPRIASRFRCGLLVASFPSTHAPLFRAIYSVFASPCHRHRSRLRGAAV